MKTYQWVLLGIAAIIVIVIIKEEVTAPINGAQNNLGVNAFGSLLSGLLHATPVSAPSASNVPAGSSGIDFTGGGAGSTTLSPTNYGSQYSAAMASTGESASESAGGSGGGGVGFIGAGGATPSLTGSGGTTNGGGLSDGLTLTPPSFDVGTGGADFSN